MFMFKKTSFLVLALLGGMAALTACDPSGSDGPSSSGLSRSAKVGMLNAADAAKLCDWTNQRQGGYGRHVSCADAGSEDMSTDPDQQTCTGAVPDIAANCPTLTVGDIEDCTNAVGLDLCTYSTVVGCATVRACFGS